MEKRLSMPDGLRVLAIGLVMNVVMNSRLNRQLGDNRYTQRL